MGLERGKDFVINIDQLTVASFQQLANNHNVGMLFLGTHKYLFNLSVYDSTATFSTQYFNGNSYIKQKNHYFDQKIKGKTVSQAVVDLLNDPEASVAELERFLIAAMAKRGEEHKEPIIKGEYIDIADCLKFKVMKMWIGGGTITYKHSNDKMQKQIPIVKAKDAKALKAFYLDDMKS